jgi:hypothetical protein
MSRMSENVGASTSRNLKGLHGLYGDNFTLPFTHEATEVSISASPCLSVRLAVCNNYKIYFLEMLNCNVL